MASRKKMIFLSVVLMFEMVFLTTHWNDYVFTPMNPNEVEEVNLQVDLNKVEGTVFVTIHQKKSVEAIIEVEDLIRKNDNTCFLVNTLPDLITFSYVLNTGKTVTRFYQEQLIHSELEHALLQIEEVKSAMKTTCSYDDEQVV